MLRILDTRSGLCPLPHPPPLIALGHLRSKWQFSQKRGLFHRHKRSRRQTRQTDCQRTRVKSHRGGTTTPVRFTYGTDRLSDAHQSHAAPDSGHLPGYGHTGRLDTDAKAPQTTNGVP